MEKVDMKEPSKAYYKIIGGAMKLPKVKISRSDYLKKELSKTFDENTVARAITTTPAEAGIELKHIDKIAKSAITLERNSVSAVSTGLGVPGGFAIAATIPADFTQYFAFLIRIMQKLLYLYGWDEIVDAQKELDDETVNLITMFMGVMFGVEKANTVIRGVSYTAAKSMEKKLAAKALTKTTYYPVIKKIAAYLGIKVTKESFAKSVTKFVPVLGGVVSGSITYATFKPCADKLMKELRQLPLATGEKITGVSDTIINV